MTAKTRLGYEGYGVRRAGTFSGKTITVNTHPVSKLTRLGEGGYGVRRYSSFAGKTSTGSVATTKRPRLFIANVGRLMN